MARHPRCAEKSAKKKKKTHVTGWQSGSSCRHLPNKCENPEVNPPVLPKMKVKKVTIEQKVICFLIIFKTLQ
jgi:hypothetical protein